MDIVSWTFEHEHHDLDTPIYIDGSDASHSLSTRGVRTLVRQLVCGLQHHGVQPGDCICMVSFNEIHYTSLYLGIMGSGACFTGANPGHTARELVHHIKITRSKVLLAELRTLPVAIEAADECGISQSNIFVLNYRNEAVPTPHQSWKTLLNHGERDWVKVDDPNTAAAFVSTSGTSGLPKAAVIPHSYLISQGSFQETTMSENEKVSSLIAVPPFHVFTMPMQHAFPLRTGSPTYVMPRFEEDSFVRALGEFNIIQTVVVPPILMALTKRTPMELSSLRKILVGGSVATNGMQQQLYSKLNPDAKVVQVYGMTEVGWATAWTRTAKDETGSVGQALPGTQIRVVASDGNPVQTASITGEVQIHTPTAMRGYLNNATATTEAFTADGWIRTGDIGYVKGGNWYIIDRTKDLIKVRGWQVSPAEIEAALLEHPDIIDAGVIGTPAADGCGQSPATFIKKTEDSRLDFEGVRMFLSTRLARYKNVEKVEFVDNIPRNPTGKILRRILRDANVPEMATKDMITAQQYASELKRLEAYRRSRTSISPNLTVSELEDEAESIPDTDANTLKQNIEQIEIPARNSKKRKCCPASPLEYLRKLRCGIRGRA